MKCEMRREKPQRYLSNRSIHGTSFQKCGRVAIATYAGGVLICSKCLKERCEVERKTEDKNEKC